MQTKTTKSYTLSKKKTSKQKGGNNNNNTNNTNTNKVVEIATIAALPIGAVLLALKFRKPLSKAIKEAFDEFMKNSAIQARIKRLAIERYNKIIPRNRRLTGLERDSDPYYIQIYSQIAEKEWAAFQQ
jgi:hypothetical protein